jgi:2-isopropylmalate synthase
VSDELYQPTEYWRLEKIQVGCGTGMPTATVRLTGPDGSVQTAAEVGTGPVDAVYKAIQTLVDVPCTLLEYTVQSVTEGIDALGEVSVRVAPLDGDAEPDKLNPQYEHSRARVFHGHGAHTDVIVASAKAYLAAINRILAIKEAKQDNEAAGSAA